MKSILKVKSQPSFDSGLLPKSRRTVIAVATVATLGIVTLLTAVPATAATTPANIDVKESASGTACDNSPPTSATVVETGTPTVVSSISWTSASDTLTVTNSCPGMSLGVFVFRNSVEVSVGIAIPGPALTTSALGTDVTEIRIYKYTGPTKGALLKTLPTTSPASDSGSSDSGSSDDGGPEPVLQQFGKTVAGTCAATAPESLNWAGVSSGGWGESWARWMNKGNGGAVCTRTLIYSTAQSRWIVG